MSIERYPEQCPPNAEICEKEEWMTIREAAAIAGYDESTVRNLIFGGKIVFEKRPVVIQRICVSLKDLMRYKKEVRIGRPPKKPNV